MHGTSLNVQVRLVLWTSPVVLFETWWHHDNEGAREGSIQKTRDINIDREDHPWKNGSLSLRKLWQSLCGSRAARAGIATSVPEVMVTGVRALNSGYLHVGFLNAESLV